MFVRGISLKRRPRVWGKGGKWLFTRGRPLPGSKGTSVSSLWSLVCERRDCAVMRLAWGLVKPLPPEVGRRVPAWFCPEAGGRDPGYRARACPAVEGDRS